MTLLVQSGHQHKQPPFRIPWPILPQPDEPYPVPLPPSGPCAERRQLDRFVRAYSSWKACTKADTYARMLPEWEALSASLAEEGDDRTKKRVQGVVHYLAEAASTALKCSTKVP